MGQLNNGLRAAGRNTGMTMGTRDSAGKTTGNGRENWSSDVIDDDARSRRRGIANGVLSKLPAEIYKKLRPHLREVVLEKDAYLYQQDDHVDSLYFPETAVISEFQILEDGRTIEVAIERAGRRRRRCIGLWRACAATSCTQVCVPGTVWKLKSDVLEREIATDPRTEPAAARADQPEHPAVIAEDHLQYIPFTRTEVLHMAARDDAAVQDQSPAGHAGTCREGARRSSPERDLYRTGTPRPWADRLPPRAHHRNGPGRSERSRLQLLFGRPRGDRGAGPCEFVEVAGQALNILFEYRTSTLNSRFVLKVTDSDIWLI